MKDSPIDSIGERIRKTRKNLGLSQTDLAEILGQSQGTVGQWETGRNKPKIHMIEKLAKALHITPLWLLYGDEKEQEGRKRKEKAASSLPISKGKILSPAQCRAARGLLHISQQKLAEEAEVGMRTIADLEREFDRALNIVTLRAIRAALESLGVEFIDENGGGPGVRLKEKTKG